MLSNAPLPSVIGPSALVNCVHFFCFSKGFSVCFEGLFCLYYLWGFVTPFFLLSSPSHKSCKEAGHVWLLVCCRYQAQIRKVKKWGY